MGGSLEPRENIMPKRKTDDTFAVLGRKDCWHLYNLQALTPVKFTTVVGKILSGHYMLVTTKSDKRMPTSFSI
jgi:hypothetical protein